MLRPALSLAMRPILAFAFVFALTGCTAVQHAVPLDDPAQVNRQLAGRAVTVVLVTGEAVPAQAVRVAQDSTSWFDPATGALVLASTADIAEIQHRDRRRAVGRGVAQGAVAGAVLGGLLGMVIGHGAGDVIPGNQAQDTVVAGLAVAMGGAAYGGAGGLVVGVLSNPTDRYVVEAPARNASGDLRGGELGPLGGVASRPARTD